jgi:hypothetical protein
MSGQLQFHRAFVAEFGDVKIEALQGEETLRVQFCIERDKLPWANNAELAVWNLNPTTRAKLTAAGPVVARISAGYDGEANQIFFGLLDIVEHIKEGPAWITRMSASDCGREIRESKISKSFAKGTLVRDVIKALLKELGLGEGNLSAFANDSDLLRPLPHGGALHGNVVEELTHFLRSAALEFSIQDGKVQFVKIGRGAPNTSGPLLTPDTGLVGSARLVKERRSGPERAELKKKKAAETGTVRAVLEGRGDPDVDSVTVCEATCLLNAAVVPGVPFRVQSETVNGGFVCAAMRHRGDSHDQEWYTELRGTPLGV